MRNKSKRRKTDPLIRKLRAKMKAGNLFDPHEEAKKELLEETKEQRKKNEEAEVS